MACRRGKCLTFCWGYSIFPCNVLLNRLGAECRLVLRRVSEILELNRLDCMATLQEHIATSSTRKQRPWFYLNGEERLAWLLVLPWIIGFLAFQLGPMLASLGLSLTEWRMFTPPKFIGLSNYAEMISGDPLVFQAFKVTTIYSVTSVPLRIALGVLVALLLNASVRGLAFIRTVYYLPATVSGVAVAMVWLLILNGDFGLLNRVLGLIGLEGPYWLTDTRTVLASFVLMSLWSVGAGIIIYLAGLQGVPNELYEAAEVDGAGDWVKFWKITLADDLSGALFSVCHWND